MPGHGFLNHFSITLFMVWRAKRSEPFIITVPRVVPSDQDDLRALQERNEG